MDQQQSLQQANHAFLIKLEREKRLHDYAVQATKLLITLNSGSAVSILAFSQALISKQLFGSYKYFAVAAIAVYLAGAAAGAGSLIIRGQRELHDSYESPYRERWQAIYMRVFTGVASSFLLGTVIAVAGIVMVF